MLDVEARLRQIWTSVVGQNEVTKTSDFINDGGTSIGAVHLAVQIQDEFDVSIDAVEIIESATFGAVSELIATRLSS